MSAFPKHVRYADQHIPGEFWGIGIEQETYLELSPIEVPKNFVWNQKRERYSVDYWTQYKSGTLEPILRAWSSQQATIRLPQLVNAHTFTRCDVAGQHRTTYTKTPAPNPKFQGAWMDLLVSANPSVFREGRDVWWCFDGDTIEFMTQRFRCGTLEDTLAELQEHKRRWLEALEAVVKTTECAWTGLRWPRNYGLAVFLTNPHNIAIFNNGTYHINLTAPTVLDKDGEIEDWPRFLHVHRTAARLFQWISPFLVAALGSADPFANLAGPNRRFPAGSQRLAASRYVSVGTYDTRWMTRGKVLHTSSWDFGAVWWREMHSTYNSAYTLQEQIGLDINFNKYRNHGLEFRIFDWFDESALEPLVRMLIGMMDYAMLVPQGVDIPVPQESTIWRRVLGRCVWEGASALLTEREQRVFASVLHIPDLVGCSESVQVYERIRGQWSKERGPCSSRMVLGPRSLRLGWIEEREDFCRKFEIPICIVEIHLHHRQPLLPCIPLQDHEIPQSKCGCLGFFGLRRTRPSAQASWGLI